MSLSVRRWGVACAFAAAGVAIACGGDMGGVGTGPGRFAAYRALRRCDERQQPSHDSARERNAGIVPRHGHGPLAVPAGNRHARDAAPRRRRATHGVRPRAAVGGRYARRRRPGRLGYDGCERPVPVSDAGGRALHRDDHATRGKHVPGGLGHRGRAGPQRGLPVVGGPAGEVVARRSSPAAEGPHGGNSHRSTSFRARRAQDVRNWWQFNINTVTRGLSCSPTRASLDLTLRSSPLRCAAWLARDRAVDPTRPRPAETCRRQTPRRWCEERCPSSRQPPSW